MAHKTGNISLVVHDAGIIWTPDGPVILIAMVEHPHNDDAANQIIRRLALLAYTMESDSTAILEVTPVSDCNHQMVLATT